MSLPCSVRIESYHYASGKGRQMPRLFVAIDLPPFANEALANICHSVERARWVDMAHFHLTLEFIGQVDARVADEVTAALAGVEEPAFEISIKGVGYFPPRKGARVLWAGVAPSEPLERLHEAIQSVLRVVGVEGDRRRFHPHITLARFREPAPHFVVGPFQAANNLFEAGPIEVEEFHLYSSILAKTGAVHTREATFPLARGYDDSR